MQKIVVGSLFCVLGACTSTPEVRSLAEATAINSAIIASELKRFASDEAALQERRLANIQRLAEALQTAQLSAALNRELLARSGDDFQSLLTELEAWIARAAALHDERAAVAEAPQIALNDYQARVAALGELAKTMSELAKENDLSSDALFVATYIGEVAKDVRAKREAARDAASASADVAPGTGLAETAGDDR